MVAAGSVAAAEVVVVDSAGRAAVDQVDKEAVAVDPAVPAASALLIRKPSSIGRWNSTPIKMVS